MTGRLTHGSGRVFNWVYDCGTTSGAAQRDLSIASYRANLVNNHVDLVTLSHFDADHINGIVALLRNLSVGHLLLPYVPLWRRLLVAMTEEIDAGDGLLDFFIDPVSYLSREIGEGLKTVIFVPEASRDDIAPPTEESLIIEGPMGDPYIQSGEPPATSEGDPSVENSGRINVHFLQSGGGVIIPHLWEFVPFNDPGKRPAMSTPFAKWCTHISKIFARSGPSRSEALKRLKKHYNRRLGKTVEDKNVISTYLYSGPVGDSLRLQHYGANTMVRFNAIKDNFSVLCTGDAYLNNGTRLAALQRFYRADRRLERSGIFQVMHHGSSANWCPGLANTLRPAVSIISSDPNFRHGRAREGHPHSRVLRDFWPWCPARVDTDTSFCLTAYWRSLRPLLPDRVRPNVAPQ